MSDLLDKKCIVMDLDESNKEAVIKTLAEKLVDTGRVNNLEDFLDNVNNREKIEPTALGDNIGMPHGRTNSVVTPSLCFARLKEPIVWNPETKEMAGIIIMIAVPKNENSSHLQIISQLARNLMHDEFRGLLLNGDEETIYETINNVVANK